MRCVSLRALWSSRRRLAGLSLALIALLYLLALPSLAIAGQQTDAATQQAVDTTFDIAQPALAAAGVNLSDEEVGVMKSVTNCAVQGAKLEDCARNVLTDQLGQVSPEAGKVANCLLQNKNAAACSEQAVIDTALQNAPDSIKNAAGCVAGAATTGGDINACVQKSIVDAVSQGAGPQVGALAGCVLSQRPVAGCASDAAIKQLPDNMQPAAQCLIDKQDPAKCVDQLAKAGGVDSLPPEVKCLSNKATAQNCLEQAAINRLPLDANQKQIAQCMMDPSKAAQCAKDQISKQLPPGVADTVNCITNVAKNPNPATCAGPAAKAAGLGDALDTLSKVMSNTDAVPNPGKAPSSLANLVKVAQGIKNNNWGDVLEYGGAELYKAAGKIVLNDILPEVVPGLGAVLAWLADPILDTMVQDRLDLVNQLLEEAKKCGKGDFSQCNPGKLSEIVGEFVLLTQVEVDCAALSASGIPDEVRKVTCGPLGAAIQAVGEAGYDAYQKADKEIAVALPTLIPGPVGVAAAAAILATDPDVQRLVTGQEGSCPVNYFASTMAVCLKEYAYLSLTDRPSASALLATLNTHCRADFKGCSHQNIDIDLSGLKGQTDSDRIDQHCNPQMSAFRQTGDALESAVQQMANDAAAGAHLRLSGDVCGPQPDVDAFIASCRNGLPSKLPGYDGAAWSQCAYKGPNPDAFGVACQAAAQDQLRQARAPILVAHGVSPTGPNADAQFGNICGACDAYAHDAVYYAKQAADQKCGLGGPRWTTDYNAHKQFCLTASQGAIDAENKARKNELDSCNVCQDYLQHVQKFIFTNNFDHCGLTGPLWSSIPADHIQYCQSHSPADMERQQAARKTALDACVAANSPPPDDGGLKLVCVDRMIQVGRGCVCPQGTQFNGRECFNFTTNCPAQQHRDVATSVCVDDAQLPLTTSGSGASGGRPPFTCPTGQFPATDGNCHCRDGALPRNGQCASGSGTGSGGANTSRQPLTCPTGQFPATDGNCHCRDGALPRNGQCGTGGVNTSKQPLTCPTGQFPATDGNCHCRDGALPRNGQCGSGGTNGTQPGSSNQGPCENSHQRRGPDGVCFSCSHNDHFDSNNKCVPCSPGSHLQDDTCVSDKASPNTGNGGTNGNSQPLACPAGQFPANDGKCHCRDGALPRNGQCASSNGTTSCTLPARLDKSNVCRCPDGTLTVNGQCGNGGTNGTTPSTGSAGKPSLVKCDPPFVGFKPTCACPPGQKQQGNGCITLAQPCTAPFVGTKPNCSCPSGTQQQGNGCVKLQVPCTPPLTGFQPNCKQPAPVPCKAPLTGFQPNCILAPCKAPLVGFQPNCKQPAPPPPPACPAGSFGKPPHCVRPGDSCGGSGAGTIQSNGACAGGIG